MIYLLIDTDILIDIANDDTIAKTRLANEAKNAVLSVSTLTVMDQ